MAFDPPRRFTVIVTDYNFPSLETEEGILRPLGIRLEAFRWADRATLTEVLSRADAVLNQAVPLDADLISMMSRCLLIVRYGVGYDGIDVEAATRAGICVANVPDYGTQEVALHAVSLLLAVHRRLSVFDAAVRRHRWPTGPEAVPPIPRLAGLILGIVGFGRIGRAVAAYAGSFGLRLLMYDPYVSAAAAQETGVVSADYDSLLRRSDFVTFHTPLTADTRHMLGERELRIMKPGAVVVNTSRGAVVDTGALAAALHSGRLAGAGIDVFEDEPIEASHPLRTAPRTILTPHVAWYSEGALQALQRSVAEDVARASRGEWPRSLVNPAVRPVARLGR
jgi:D-3-phosphoglycerate dehydrogenase / 2-oxoglutarate reductase